ncbi:hypothetical protein N658DRAFT_301321 [Parathielavia hyrcaniae]|uniref:Uncharacterized protein n=1 Tax=Parathielavia hyrcaniae TaxID=113614 RepID=A0AAN6Q3W9_9PEZI|nr:hypothetical protein N658DRAFT_301321 [Parathielavia hyrcaniae]
MIWGSSHLAPTVLLPVPVHLPTMPIRNPFARRAGPAIQDESQRPGSAASGTTTTDAAHPGFERVDTVGSKASSAFSRRSQDTGEYKMSVVNDSGVYLPPSPVEREAAWPRRYLSRTSSDRSSGGEIEHFSISRESFDSYRRSFDISAKSPVVMTDPSPTRQSLDSHRFPFSSPRYAPRSSLGDQLRPQSQSQSQSQPTATHRRWDWRGGHREPPTPEESWKGEVEEDGDEGRFEDVGLDDDGAKQQQQQQAQGHEEAPPVQAPKKRGFFAKFGSDSGNAAGTGNVPAEDGGTAAVSRFLPLPLVGRKAAQGAGQQQQGAELKAMPVAGLGRQLQEVEV